VSKQVGDYYATEPGAYREHYIRDAQGNIMATYRYTNTGAASLKLNERPVYGSSRLGSLREEVELHTLPSFDPATANPVQMVDLNYELTDHLGNVCAVVTGRLLDGNGGGTAKQAELVSAQGYEPFGSLLPGRNYNSESSRHLFQGQENDYEINHGVGTSYAFEYRMHDPRVGRFLSIDPLAALYPHNSPFSFSENRVNDGIELEGMEYLDKEDARIQLINGELRLKISNFHWQTRDLYANMSNWKYLPSVVIAPVTLEDKSLPSQTSANLSGVNNKGDGPNKGSEPFDAEKYFTRKEQMIDGYNRKGKREKIK
jgi:RHS repeat-associated protein